MEGTCRGWDDIGSDVIGERETEREGRKEGRKDGWKVEKRREGRMLRKEGRI
jgi:hypothetical protein